MLLASASACKNSETKATGGDAGISRALGKAGESCTARADCARGLACIAGVCSMSATVQDAGRSADGAAAPISDPRGGAGESCTSHRDCQEKLACIDNRCVADTSKPQDAGPVTASQRGAKGESCASRADCVDGLACVGGVCRDIEVPLTALPRECHEVQCKATADCCKDFPVVSAQCMSYMMQCSMGTTSACSFYKQTCECTKVCDGDQCVQDLSCTGDTDCADPYAIHCYDKKCVQCRDDTDCTTLDQKCVAHVCKKPCTHDEECPYDAGVGGGPITITACMAGDCVERKCASDRECYFASGDHDAKCGSDGKCTHPCLNDGECAAKFNVCEKGLCVFVGCSTDQECRLALGLGTPGSISTAVCR
jgi:hypothetical protein